MKSTLSIISLDFLSANLIGSTTLKSESFFTTYIAVYSWIFVPIEIKIGFLEFYVLLKAAPHIFPLSPFKSAKSPPFFISLSHYYFTLSFVSPSI